MEVLELKQAKEKIEALSYQTKILNNKSIKLGVTSANMSNNIVIYI